MQFALQMTIAVLVSFAGTVLAVAEMEDPSGSPLGAFSIPVSLATLLLVDHKRLIALPEAGATLLGALAFLLAAAEFTSGGIESRLLAASHLLVYLTWIFLLQRKAARQYWWIHALAVLQIAVSSVLTSKPWFGLVVVAFAFLGSWSMALFLVVRTVEPALNRERWKVDEKTQSVGQAIVGLAYDRGHHLINWRFVGSSMALSVAGLLVSVVFFLFTPRIWMSNSSIASDLRGGRGGTTGFSETVRLGDLGSVLESKEPAIEVTVFNMREQRDFTSDETLIFMGDEPLFRGAVLEEYSNGAWRRSDFEDDYALPPFSELPLQFQQFCPVKQHMKLYPMGSEILPAFGTVFTVDAGDKPFPVRREYHSGELLHKRNFGWGTLDYWVYEYPNDPRDTHRLLGIRADTGAVREYLRSMMELPDNLRRLKFRAEELTRDERTESGAARVIQSYLQDSGEFTYSLDLSIDDPAIDPVEDFLFNRKQGHCEYYASSMALMLRSISIPARVVTGFKGGSWDDSRQTYVVQQLHAHAWVEAFVDRRWRTFDPTPAARNESVLLQQGEAPLTQSFGATYRTLWSQGVAMNMQQQRDLLYAPVLETAANIGRLFQEPLDALLSRDGSSQLGGRAEPLLGLIVIVVLSIVVVGVIFAVRWLLRFSPRWRLGRKSQLTRTRVEFFERFQAILRRYGLQRKPQQTPVEFAEDVVLQLNPMLQAAGLNGWPRELVQSFYDVRFGHHDLTPQELVLLNAKLAELEHCLSQQRS